MTLAPMRIGTKADKEYRACGGGHEQRWRRKRAPSSPVSRTMHRSAVAPKEMPASVTKAMSQPCKAPLGEATASMMSARPARAASMHARPGCAMRRVGGCLSSELPSRLGDRGKGRRARKLQRPNISDNRPTVPRSDARPEGIHGAVAIRDCVEKLSRRSRAKPRERKGGRSRKSARDDDAIPLPGKPMARRAEDFVTLTSSRQQGARDGRRIRGGRVPCKVCLRYRSGGERPRGCSVRPEGGRG